MHIYVVRCVLSGLGIGCVYLCIILVLIGLDEGDMRTFQCFVVMCVCVRVRVRVCVCGLDVFNYVQASIILMYIHDI